MFYSQIFLSNISNFIAISIKCNPVKSQIFKMISKANELSMNDKRAKISKEKLFSRRLMKWKAKKLLVFLVEV